MALSPSSCRPISSSAYPPWPSSACRPCRLGGLSVLAFAQQLRRLRLLGGEFRQLPGVVLVQRAGAPALALVLLRQRIHDRHQIVVADALELADRQAVRLLVRLIGDQVDQLVVELRHVHQLGPRPFQRRTELRHEVAHAGLAAGDAVDLEHAHLRPAQAEGVAHDVVEFFDGGDAVLDQPQRLAPRRLEQAVADEGLDLLADDHRLHADRRIDFARPAR